MLCAIVNMYVIILLCSFLFSSVCSAELTPLTVPIEGRIVIPDPTRRVGNHILSLNGNEYITITRVDGSFTFENIPTGIYLLDITTAIHDIFPILKIRVSAEEGLVTAVEYKYPGAKRLPANYPVVLTAMAPLQYTLKKPPLSIVGMLMANPMMIMMVFMLIVVIGMPKLLQGMSPEELEELQKQSATSGDPMKKIKNMMGMGGSAADDDDDN
mmetsp:Transcript_22987/g.33014  ORF Transcript_22987/g.33014 Transcript_22987/m.33014 type:complete len:213 (-) Transcript_22987:70-708(-)